MICCYLWLVKIFYLIQSQPMSENAENTINNVEDFRLFIARILLGSVFLVLFALMGFYVLGGVLGRVRG